MADKVREIACENACSIPETRADPKTVADRASPGLDRLLVERILSAEADTSGYGKLDLVEWLLDVDERRSPQIDEFGVDMRLLTLIAPE